MTRTISLKLALICLGLTACAQHNPAEANCFNFRDAQARAGSSTTTVSTMGTAVTRRDTRMLGAGG
jgi:hypothetical protein